MNEAGVSHAVIIVGGGPAGAVAALTLARAGARVLVIDRQRTRRVEAAEILSPEGRVVLEREDLWRQMPLDLTWPCPAMAEAWEGPEPRWTSFATHPLGCAWHVDRIRFDAWLADRMRAAGVDVVEGVVDAVERRGDSWRVQFATGDARRAAAAPCLVLATGRTSRAIRLAPRRVVDTLCLVAGLGDRDPTDPDALIVEAAADGWWYSAPLVSGRLFTGWMTDFSLVADGRYVEAAEASRREAPIHARRGGAPALTTIIGSAAWAMDPAAGPGWIAIGDAALARDPISGDGLTAALRSGVHGADVVRRALNGETVVWAEAAREADATARRYEQQRLDLYRIAGRRWPASAFWRRFEVTGRP